MNKQTGLIVVAMVVGLTVNVIGKYGGGTGEPNDPYLIFTADQINSIGADANDWDKHFKLMMSLDLGDFTGTSFNIIGDWGNPFSGVFDGGGNTIANLTYVSNSAGLIGLFGYVDGTNAEIKNLGLIDANIDVATGTYIGSLVGLLRDGTITNCESSGYVSGDIAVGGLVGANEYGTVTNCYSAGEFSWRGVGVGMRVGGLVGENNGTITSCNSSGYVFGFIGVGGLVGENNGTITSCKSSGYVSGAGGFNIGGLVGANEYGTVTNCYSSSDVDVLGDSGFGIGGLVGSGGTITNCYATGNVSGYTWVGGLVGNGGIINNCYAAGNVEGGFAVGGLVGSGSWITNCYSVGSVSGNFDVGGLVGIGSPDCVFDSFWDVETSGQTTSVGGTGKTTTEMQTMSNFTDAGWDFTTPVWTIDEGNDYPRLWWETLVSAEVEIDPNTLNLKSKGKWITCYIWLPDDHSITDVESESVLFENEFQSEIFIIDEEKQVAIAKFNREVMKDILTIGETELTITGQLTDGTMFEGTDVVRIINKGRK